MIPDEDTFDLLWFPAAGQYRRRKYTTPLFVLAQMELVPTRWIEPAAAQEELLFANSRDKLFAKVWTFLSVPLDPLKIAPKEARWWGNLIL